MLIEGETPALEKMNFWRRERSRICNPSLTIPGLSLGNPDPSGWHLDWSPTAQLSIPFSAVSPKRKKGVLWGRSLWIVLGYK
jgi:hypothetical protein